MIRKEDFQTETVRHLFEVLDHGVMVWDRDRRLIFQNSAAVEILRAETPLGSAVPEIPIAKLFTEENTEIPPTSLPLMRAFEGEVVVDEKMQLIDRSGEQRWLSVSARPIDKDGELEYVISAFRDISVRKSREDKLQFMVESAKILSVTQDFLERVREKARLTIPTLADWCAIDILNENGSIERVAAEHQEPYLAQYIYMLRQEYPDDPDQSMSARVIRTGESVLIPVIKDELVRSRALSPAHEDALEKLRPHSIMVIPIQARGKTLGSMSLAFAASGRTYSASDLEFFQEFCFHLGVLLDNAVLFDELAKRDKAKDLFLASLSHELRNPLAPIKSTLELLKLKDFDTDTREDLATIEHQFDHMARLLNDLLDVTRFTQDKIVLAPKPHDLRRLVERSVKAVDSLLRSADITLHVAFPSWPVRVVVDETRIEQAIINLMNNAIKFTPSGGSIWVDIEQKNGSEAYIRVRDNGAGIRAEDLPHIFQMYYQNGGTNRNMKAGLGIGLLLVQRIVTMHGGSVEARSEGLGFGSEFIISLPIAEMSTFNENGAHAEASAPRKRILIVDDNAPAADSLAKLLNKLGAEATALYSGREVLARTDLDTFQLFLLDIGMPEMDGYELVQSLRGRGIQQPIVALTGYGLADDKQRAHDAGFNSHLTKPIGIKELNEMFQTVGM